MARILSVLLWTGVFLLIVLAIDQSLVRLPARHPAHVAVATFYRDLRARAIDLVRGTPPPGQIAAPGKAASPAKGKEEKPAPAPSIEGIIGQRQPPPSAPAAAKPVTKPAAGNSHPTAAKPRYVYADNGGELHFADTLAEVPEEYRGKAKRLGE